MTTVVEIDVRQRTHLVSQLLGRSGRWALNIVLLVGALLMFVPFWWVLVVSFSNPIDALNYPPRWWPTHFTLENFVRLFQSVPYGRFIINSFEVAVLATAGALITSSLAGYAFARLEFPGRRVLFICFLAGMMVPPQITVIPTFVVMKNLSLVNTEAALFLPGMISVFGVFLMRQFFASIPRDLEEAAYIDGAGYFRTFVQIVFPLAKPALIVLAVLVFETWWNDFFWANIFLYSPEKLTLPVGLTKIQGVGSSASTATIFAGIAVLFVPVFIMFLFLQRYITETFASVGVRG